MNIDNITLATIILTIAFNKYKNVRKLTIYSCSNTDTEWQYKNIIITVSHQPTNFKLHFKLGTCIMNTTVVG